jgi:hypothetical protein
MAQVVRFRLSRSAMRATTAVDAAGVAAVVLTPVGAPQAAGLTIPLRLRGQRPFRDCERHQYLQQQGGEDGGARQRAMRVRNARGDYD